MGTGVERAVGGGVRWRVGSGTARWSRVGCGIWKGAVLGSSVGAGIGAVVGPDRGPELG